MQTNLPIGALPPSTEATEARSFLDPHGLDGLKAASASSPHDPATLRAVAQQFEALFIGMMMKSMREAKLGDGLFDSDQSRLYQDMFDTQLAGSLSQGKGLGIADMLVRSLTPPTQGAAVSHVPGTYAPLPARPTVAAPETAAVLGIPGSVAPASEAVAQVDGAAAGGSAGATLSATPEDFVALVMPAAEAAGASLGVNPLALVAQAALESNWGRQVPTAGGASSFNVFGIKADPRWAGKRIIKDTLEYAGGVPERRREPFRAYESLSHGFEDYAAFLKGNERYAAALRHGADPERFVAALHQAGYATDPGYSAKITAVLRSSTFRHAVTAFKDAGEQPIF